MGSKNMLESIVGTKEEMAEGDALIENLLSELEDTVTEAQSALQGLLGEGANGRAPDSDFFNEVETARTASDKANAKLHWARSRAEGVERAAFGAELVYLAAEKERLEAENDLTKIFNNLENAFSYFKRTNEHQQVSMRVISDEDLRKSLIRLDSWNNMARPRRDGIWQEEESPPKPGYRHSLHLLCMLRESFNIGSGSVYEQPTRNGGSIAKHYKDTHQEKLAEELNSLENQLAQAAEKIERYRIASADISAKYARYQRLSGITLEDNLTKMFAFGDSSIYKGNWPNH